MNLVKIFITGRPGVGKSTLIRHILEYLQFKKVSVGGIITPEVREKGRRIGFKIVDLMSNESDFLASIYIKSNYRVGKYYINLDALHRIGINALDVAIKKAQVIIVDEIGKMELISNEFKRKLIDSFAVKKPVIATIGLYFVKLFINEVKKRVNSSVLVYELTRENFNHIKKSIVDKLGLNNHQKLF